MRVKIFLLLIILLLRGYVVHGGGENKIVEPKLRKCFLYTAKRFGVPILKTTIEIDYGSIQQGKSLFHVHANVNSLNHLALFFRMNNHFVSTIEGETLSPIQYVKEIDQSGILIKNKKYVQIFTFDAFHQKVVAEKQGQEGKEEVSLPPGTCDPLSIFARYYLRNEFQPNQDIHISLFDGIKLRQMVFHLKKERVKSEIYDEVEAMCVESKASFSTFGDKEGTIRIWYTADDKRIPIAMELGLPIGSLKFELEEIIEG